MKNDPLDFFKKILEMINSGALCSEILDQINEQPENIKNYFVGTPKMTLKERNNKIFKNLLTQPKVIVGISWSNLPANKITNYDMFMASLTLMIKSFENK